MKFFRSLLAALAVAVPLLALAGTGPAEAQSTWTEIKERGALRVGVTQAPPWFFKDPSKNEWSGLGISVGGAMAKTLGVKLEPVEVTWGTAVASLKANKIDIMLVLDATPERAMAVAFPAQQIARASCRERVCRYVSLSVVAVSLQQK